ncbi:MAG UNVERIFIED_CONTAM: hypothetical protein LVR29_25570 [Microcystis novacekii LVE1205-3]
MGNFPINFNQRLVLNIDDTFNTLAPLLSWFPYGLRLKSQATLIYGKLVDGKFVSLFNCDIEKTTTGENLMNLQVNPEYMLLYDIYFQNNYLLNKEDLNKFSKIKN